MVLKLNEADKKVVRDSRELAEILQRLLCLEDIIDQEKEHFYCIHLDTRNRIRMIEVVAIGILNASIVHPREIFRRAITEGAFTIIVAHNHPSGMVDPSDVIWRKSQVLITGSVPEWRKDQTTVCVVATQDHSGTLPHRTRV